MITGFFNFKVRDDADFDAFQRASLRMKELVAGPRFGLTELKSYMGEEGDVLLVGKFESAEGLEAWRKHPEHVETQQRGRDEWFAWYRGGDMMARYEFDRATGRHALP